MKNCFKVVAEMWWSQWLGLVVTGIPIGLEVGAVEVSLTDACRGSLNNASISGRQSSGDHLVLEQVGDEEAEMVFIGRILSEKCSSQAA
ncbi:hypothetical protein NL676_035200 [Syzygium grande]|nr:hypothetical protein NL676_035200 [Syzygium grande]